MKRLSFAVLSLGLALTGQPSASAHAVLTDSNPKMFSTVKSVPTLIWVEFNEDLIDMPGKSINFLDVTDQKGKTITIGKSFVGGARVSVKVRTKPSSGRYTLSWRIVSGDGHVVKGSTFFFVK